MVAVKKWIKVFVCVALVTVIKCEVKNFNAERQHERRVQDLVDKYGHNTDRELMQAQVDIAMGKYGYRKIN